MKQRQRNELFEAWTAPLPPRTHTEAGVPRRIGVEIEMIGLDVKTIADIVAADVGGEIEEKSRYEYLIHGDVAGDWGVELDYKYLKEKGRADPPDQDILAVLDETAESVVRAGAEMVVPVEVVGPPLPMPRLSDVQALIAKLRDAGARGTGASLTYAFGMQFNPELPALDAATIVSYLKAFLCLYDWLLDRSTPDLTRRLTGFSAAFPARYVRKVIAPDYWPERDTLIDDYLADNPTRNRALDLLPLFLHLDKPRLRAVVDDPRVKPRPTLHYRLPNCEIDREDWGIHLAWGDWLEVEALAADRAQLREICTQYAKWLDEPLTHLFDDWAAATQSWLDARGAR